MITYPLSIAANWRAADAFSLSSKEQDWLLESGSLTVKLKSQAAQFSVEVLNEQRFTLSSQHQNLLATSASTALNREVLLICDHKPVVYAQSWLPEMAALQQQQLLNMGNKPLGDVIFQQPSLSRQWIEIAQLNQQGSFTPLLQALGLQSHALWGRRSLFSLSNSHFLVAEVFLPEAYIYQ